MVVRFQKLDARAKIPTRANELDAGLDFYCVESFMIGPHEVLKVHTGIAWEPTLGLYYLQLHGRSSLALKGIDVLGGVVDAGYRGEICFVLHNVTDLAIEFQSGAKIGQGVVHSLPYYGVEETAKVGDSERGTDGFGSTGT